MAGGQAVFCSRGVAQWLRSVREGFSSGSLEGKNFEKASPGTLVVTSWTIFTHPSVLFLPYILSICL